MLIVGYFPAGFFYDSLSAGDSLTTSSADAILVTPLPTLSKLPATLFATGATSKTTLQRTAQSSQAQC